jgi:hypothetical protein
MCQKHGDCRNLSTSSTEVEEEEWDDGASVRSEASDLSDDQNLSDGTPVNSDDEDTIGDMLSSKLNGLHMK